MPVHIVNTHQAKSQLSELIRKAEKGHEVIVARNGKPAARIVAWEDTHPTRTPGEWAGKVQYSSDVVTSDPDVVDAFRTSADSDLL